MSLKMHIHCSCCMFRPHMGHHKATVIIWGDYCTVYFVLSTIRHIAVINFLRRIFLFRLLWWPFHLNVFHDFIFNPLKTELLLN
jgi:hypothetical protein